MADDRLQQQHAPHPLDHPGGDSDLWRLHRDLVTLSARLRHLSVVCRSACSAPPLDDYDPPTTTAEMQERIRHEEH